MKATFLIAILLFVSFSLSAQTMAKEQVKRLNAKVESFRKECGCDKPSDGSGKSEVIAENVPFNSKHAVFGCHITKDGWSSGYKFAMIDRDGNIIYKEKYDTLEDVIYLKISRVSPESMRGLYNKFLNVYNTQYGTYKEFDRNDTVAYQYPLRDPLRKNIEGFPEYAVYSSHGYVDEEQGVIRLKDWKEILPRKYYKIDVLYDGYFSISNTSPLANPNILYALVDSNGIFVTDFTYGKIAEVQVQKEGSGKSYAFDFVAGSFGEKAERSDGKYFAAVKNWKWGIIDRKGSVLVPFIFDGDDDYGSKKDLETRFWNGVLTFVYGNVKGKGYVCDGKGNKVCGMEKNQIAHLWQDCNVIVGKGNRGIISQVDSIYDNKGRVTNMLNVNKNLMWHFNAGKWTLKNRKGKKIAGPFDNYKFIGQVQEENVFIVGNGDKWGMIDKTGKVLIPIEKISVDFIKSGNVEVQDNGDYYQIYSRTGKRLSEEKLTVWSTKELYFSYGGAPEAVWFENIEGKWGLCRQKDMKVLVPFVCEKTGTELKFGMATAFYKGRWYYINELGEGLPDEAYQQNK